MKNKNFTMGDLSVELFEIRTICDVTADYAISVDESGMCAADPGAAFEKLSYMIQLIQERVAKLDDAVTNSISKKE